MPSLTSPAPLSALDAVNVMLRSRGLAPTTLLGAGAGADAQSAEDQLALQSLLLQSQRWNFNRVDSMKLTPNPVSLAILLPTGLLDFFPTGPSQDRSLRKFGPNLYDADRSSLTFKADDEVFISATMAWPFEDLPMPAKWLVTVRAALAFANEEQPGEAAIRFTQAQLEEALADFKHYDSGLSPSQMTSQGPFMYGQRRRGRGRAFDGALDV